MEAELETDFSQPLRDSLKETTKQALDKQAMESGFTGGNQDERYCQEYDVTECFVCQPTREQQENEDDDEE
jgi:hypothetical protein